MRSLLALCCLALALLDGNDARESRQYNFSPFYQPQPYFYGPQGVRFLWGTTVTTTSTLLSTCTVFNATPCRRKRDLDEEAIAPSAVANRIEPTVVATLESARNERQIPIYSQQPYQLHSTFGGAYPTYNYYNPYQPIAPVPERLFLGSGATVTSTALVVSTFTSRPSCSRASGFPQC